MLAGANTIDREAVEAMLGWWREAGVDTLVEDQPRSWLAGVTQGREGPQAEDTQYGVPKGHRDTVFDVPRPTSSGDTVFGVPRLPATLAAFRAWLAETPDLPDGSAPERRVLPEGGATSGVMVFIDTPDSANALLSGEAGRLFERMLAAIGLARETVYLASLSFERRPGSRLDAEMLAALGVLGRHHAALVAPRRLLVMGEAASRALLATDLVAGRNRLLAINHHDASIETVVTFSPAMLLRNPAFKAESWRDLRLLMKGLGS